MISKKGYDENWAIWGFLFGVIAIIIILVKPNVNQAKNASEKVWKCVFCKNVNSLSDDSCVCGKTKEDTVNAIRAYKLRKMQEQNIALLKKYKELLDQGVITQQDFDAKKKELLQ